MTDERFLNISNGSFNVAQPERKRAATNTGMLIKFN